MTTGKKKKPGTRRSSRATTGHQPLEHVATNAHWVTRTEIKVNGRNVEPGVEVKIRGETGRFVFKRHVLNPANGKEWIDVYGGRKGEEQVRSFRPDRITTVHRTRKARSSR